LALVKLNQAQASIEPEKGDTKKDSTMHDLLDSENDQSIDWGRTAAD
jgi:hypothetical protein